MMQTKLTLRIDDELIRKAKARAAASGKSLSQFVAEYFSLLDAGESDAPPFTPTVARLKGSLRDSGVTEDDYGRYLEDKYL